MEGMGADAPALDTSALKAIELATCALKLHRGAQKLRSCTQVHSQESATSVTDANITLLSLLDVFTGFFQDRPSLCMRWHELKTVC